jgi:hypothetical protein
VIPHGQGVRCRRAQPLDTPLAKNSRRLARHDGEERNQRDDGQAQRRPSEPGGGVEQIGDEPLDAEADRQRKQPAQGREEDADPGRTPAAHRHGRAVRRLDRLHGLLGDDDPARWRRVGGLVMRYGDDIGPVEAKGAGLAGHEKLLAVIPGCGEAAGPESMNTRFSEQRGTASCIS